MGALYSVYDALVSVSHNQRRQENSEKKYRRQVSVHNATTFVRCTGRSPVCRYVCCTVNSDWRVGRDTNEHKIINSINAHMRARALLPACCPHAVEWLVGSSSETSK